MQPLINLLTQLHDTTNPFISPSLLKSIKHVWAQAKDWEIIKKEFLIRKPQTAGSSSPSYEDQIEDRLITPLNYYLFPEAVES